MQLHQQTIESLMHAVQTRIGREEESGVRDRLWVIFLSELHRQMNARSVSTPNTKCMFEAMEAIGITLTDFVEPTRMA